MNSTRHVFDVGNTRIKVGRFHNHTLTEVRHLSTADEMRALLAEDPSPAIVSSVAGTLEQLSLSPRSNLLELTASTALPIEIDYLTKDTLGKDRVAGAVGAATEFPGEDCLIIDTGTCVNYDFIDSGGTFRGGMISPGFTMRIRAMHEGTRGLPDISATYDEIPSRFPGQSTVECLKQGVELGLMAEVRGVIERLRRDHEDLRVILTGGDWKRFESFAKDPIFARPEIVLIGLNRILEHNEVV